MDRLGIYAIAFVAFYVGLMLVLKNQWHASRIERAKKIAGITLMTCAFVAAIVLSDPDGCSVDADVRSSHLECD